MTDPKPEITRVTLLISLQVCVPENWTDDQAEQFANQEHPAGTQHGWAVRKGEPDERVKCSGRAGCVHILLDC